MCHLTLFKMADGKSIDWEDNLFRDDASKVSENESDDDHVIFYYIYNVSTCQKCECKSMCQRAHRFPCK